ncbi:MAG TPA: tetratricopeptide repeat protein, partial [Vulgatibacter sp.]
MDPLVANLLWAGLLGMAVGAVVGVLVAAAGKKRGGEESQAAGRAYLSSFRYVLEGDSEGAIEELGKLETAGPDSLAASLALGAIFRRKGDLVRAVRLHEGILATPDLPDEWRRSAEFELGVDFRRLGMFSRSIALLEGVAREVPGHREALRELREICEEIGDWERAAFHQSRLEALGASAPALSAHLHAGHARKLLAGQRLADAADAIDRALAADPRSADAQVARAELALARDDGAAAIDSLAEALRLRPEALFSVFPLLEAGFAS